MMVGICLNPEIISFIRSDPFVVSRIGASPLHEEGPLGDQQNAGIFYLAGIDENGSPIGYCKCFCKAGIEIEVHPAIRGLHKSQSVEFFNDCMKWLFDHFEMVVRISTQVTSNHPEVKRFVEKRLGFSYEGTMRRACVRDSGYYDLHVLSILREEYERRQR